MKIIKISSYIIVALCAFFLAACGHAIKISEYRSHENFIPDSRLSSSQSLPEVSLSIINTGESITTEAFTFSGGRWLTDFTMPHSAFLIRHPKGTILFDTGLGADIDEQYNEEMPFYMKPLMTYIKRSCAKAQLQEAGIDPTQVQSVIVSHLHWDHVSGLEDFPEAMIRTTKEEYDYGKKMASDDPSFMASQFDDEGIQWQFIEFQNKPYENFTQSLDLYNDGSLVLVPLPGHTPGSVGMFVNLRSGKRFLLSGGLSWTDEGVRVPTGKFWLSSLIADWDKEITKQTLVQVHRLMKRYPELVVVPSHDDRIQKQVSIFPEFY
jgi:glyoxylase-like metal-dependent hydrolase (beta-lactamase superfamily II)